MSKERLEEIKKNAIDYYDKITLNQKDFIYLIERAQELEKAALFTHNLQAEQVQKLENRNKELEYASKYNGELNEFLQKRKLPPNILGRHVVDVVMDYVQELEHDKEHFKLIKERQGEEYRNIYEQNKRYREALGFYAKERNWEDSWVITLNGQELDVPLVIDDCGYKARIALEGESE